MNTTKISSYGKLIAFFLVVLVLLSTFAIAAGGWQIVDQPQTDNNEPQDDNTDKTPDDEINKEETPRPPEPEVPKYYDYITGLEVTESQSKLQRIAYVIDSNSPLCGIADCSMLMEFPTESGTRFLMLTNPRKDYTKIGSLSATRGYISNLATVFGASLISLGQDDSIVYDSLELKDSAIDLLKNPGSYYSEYTYFNYTTPSLVNPILKAGGQNVASLPYNLIDVGAYAPLGSIEASNIALPYQSPTSLSYSAQSGKYTLIKSNSDKIDVSSSSQVTFNNVFILFADSMTYENAHNTELVMKTLGLGEGFYVQNGKAERITWSLTDDGQMTFYNASGAKLDVNRGNSYIGFVKSSQIKNVIFS